MVSTDFPWDISRPAKKRSRMCHTIASLVTFTLSFCLILWFSRLGEASFREFQGLFWLRITLIGGVVPLTRKASTAALDPCPKLGRPRLTFNRDGTFKITVFSDLHFGENPWDAWGPIQDFNSLKLLRRILPDEKPDYSYAILALSLRTSSYR